MTTGKHREQIALLRRKIAELTERLPAHSVKPEMFQQLEQLQEELAALLEQGGDRGPAD